MTMMSDEEYEDYIRQNSIIVCHCGNWFCRKHDDDDQTVVSP